VCDTDGKLSDDKLREVAAHENVGMFELKLVQGAKPGKGGILPGEKVTEKNCENYKRVARYETDIINEIELIAHSIVVNEPRLLRHRHMRRKQDNGRLVPMNEL
jgi:hypothetical protein